MHASPRSCCYPVGQKQDLGQSVGPSWGEKSLFRRFQQHLTFAFIESSAVQQTLMNCCCPVQQKQDLWQSVGPSWGKKSLFRRFQQHLTFACIEPSAVKQTLLSSADPFRNRRYLFRSEYLAFMLTWLFQKSIENSKPVTTHFGLPQRGKIDCLSGKEREKCQRHFFPAPNRKNFIFCTRGAKKRCFFALFPYATFSRMT